MYDIHKSKPKYMHFPSINSNFLQKNVVFLKCIKLSQGSVSMGEIESGSNELTIQNRSIDHSTLSDRRIESTISESAEILHGALFSIENKKTQNLGDVTSQIFEISVFFFIYSYVSCYCSKRAGDHILFYFECNVLLFICIINVKLQGFFSIDTFSK